jgi:hypothetical protein
MSYRHAERIFDNLHGPSEPMLDTNRPSRLRGPLAHYEDDVAHVSTVPRMCVTNNCSPNLYDNVEDFVALFGFIMVARRRHESSEAPTAVVALVLASVYVEPSSYHAALVSPKAADWQKSHAFGIRLTDLQPYLGHGPPSSWTPRRHQYMGMQSYGILLWRRLTVQGPFRR